jgi:hypothetical protein
MCQPIYKLFFYLSFLAWKAFIDDRNNRSRGKRNLECSVHVGGDKCPCEHRDLFFFFFSISFREKDTRWRLLAIAKNGRGKKKRKKEEDFLLNV